MLGGIVQIDLVGTDAEAADDEQVLSLRQYLGRQLCLGPDADNVDITFELYVSYTNNVIVGERVRG